MKRFLSFANRHVVHAMWSLAFLAAVYVLLGHRPGTLPNKNGTQSINEWIAETTPLRSLFGQLERDLASGSMPLRQAIDVAETYLDDSVLKEALFEFVGDSSREKMSHMLILWVVRRAELDSSAAARAQIENLRQQHLHMFPHSAVPPVCRF